MVSDGHFSYAKTITIQYRGNIVFCIVALSWYQRLLDSKFSYRKNNEGLLKVMGGNVRYTTANVFKTV